MVTLVGLKLLELALELVTTKPKLALLPPLGRRFCQLAKLTLPCSLPPATKVPSQFHACNSQRVWHQRLQVSDGLERIGIRMHTRCGSPGRCDISARQHNRHRLRLASS